MPEACPYGKPRVGTRLHRVLLFFEYKNRIGFNRQDTAPARLIAIASGSPEHEVRRRRAGGERRPYEIILCGTNHALRNLFVALPS
jgi:hypothetical protein